MRGVWNRKQTGMPPCDRRAASKERIKECTRGKRRGWGVFQVLRGVPGVVCYGQGGLQGWVFIGAEFGLILLHAQHSQLCPAAAAQQLNEGGVAAPGIEHRRSQSERQISRTGMARPPHGALLATSAGRGASGAAGPLEEAGCQVLHSSLRSGVREREHQR